MILAHKIRIDPTYKQEAYFRRACGTARFTYNWAIAEWKRLHDLGEKPTGMSLKKQFNAIRGTEFPWTYDVHRDCTARAFANVQRAFVNFFKKRTKYPKFHKQGHKDSFYISNDKLRLQGKVAIFPVLGKVKLREALRFEGKIMNATVKRKADAWFLVVQIDVGNIHKSRIANDCIGIDLGLTNFATLSTGEKIEGPKALKQSLKKLRRLSKLHSRKQRGSKNRKKAVVKLAKYHRHVADIRNDFLHKLSTRLSRENQTITIEYLSVRNMLRNKYLARSISDAGWSEFRRQLMYKMPMHDSSLIIVDKFYPSSKTCSNCGSIKQVLKLSEREYTCESCGITMDRDLNAALNLKQIGWVTPEFTPVDTEALIAGYSNETMVAEAGIHSTHKCVQGY